MVYMKEDQDRNKMISKNAKKTEIQKAEVGGDVDQRMEFLFGKVSSGKDLPPKRIPSKLQPGKWIKRKHDQKLVSKEYRPEPPPQKPITVSSNIETSKASVPAPITMSKKRVNSRKLQWSDSQVALIKWFREARECGDLPYASAKEGKSFSITPWQTIINTESYYNRMDSDIKIGPTGSSSRSGVLFQELALLKGSVEKNGELSYEEASLISRQAPSYPPR